MANEVPQAAQASILHKNKQILGRFKLYYEELNSAGPNAKFQPNKKDSGK